MALSKSAEERRKRRNERRQRQAENPNSDDNTIRYFPVRFTEETGKTSYIKMDVKKGDDVEVLKLDIIPFIIGDNYPDKSLHAHEDESPALHYAIHKRWGENAPSVICPKETFGKHMKCSLCDKAWAAYEEAKKAGMPKPSDDETFKLFKPQRRVLYNAIDKRDPKNEKLELYDVSYFQFHRDQLEVAAKVKGKEVGMPTVFYEDIEEGYTLNVTLQKDDWGGNDFYKPTSINLVERSYAYDESKIDEAIQLDMMLDVLPPETL